MNKRQNEKIIAVIDNPVCFLPESNRELKTILDRIKNNSKWKIISSKDSNKLAEKNLIAYRQFDGLNIVRLIKIEEKLNPYIYFEASCDEKKINLDVYYDLKSDCLRSSLLIKNDKYGLVVTEWSNDRGRKFTNEALKIVRDEMIKP